MSNIIHLSPEKLLAWQARRVERDLAQRPKDIRLEEIMILRGKGAQLIRSDYIEFDDDE